MEQPPLVGHRLAGVRTSDQAVTDQFGRLQDRGSLSGCRPQPLLDAGDHHQRPLQALGSVCGQESDAPSAHLGLAGGVGRDLLGSHLGEESAHPTRTGRLFAGIGRGEQCDHRVQITVGATSAFATGQARRPQPLRPLGARPQRPQHIGRPTRRIAEGLRRALQQLGQAPDGRHLRCVGQPGEAFRLSQRIGDELTGTARDQRGAGLFTFHLEQQPAQGAQAHGVQPDQRGGEQPLGFVGVELVAARFGTPQHHLECQQQRPDGLLGQQRNLIAGHLDRDTGRYQGAGDRCDLPPARADQHRDVGMPESFVQMRPAQLLGNQLRLLGLSRTNESAHLGARLILYLAAQHSSSGIAQHRKRQPAGDPPPRRGDAGGAPVQGIEGEHRGRFSGGGAKGVGEVGERARMGATEPEHHLVGVADGQDRAARADQGTQQADLRRVEFAVLVDDHAGDLAPYRRGQFFVGEHDPSAVHQLGIVEAALVVEDVEVLGEEPSDAHPFVATRGPSSRHHVVRIEAELPNTRDRRPNLARECASPDRLVNLRRPRFDAAAGQ